MGSGILAILARIGRAARVAVSPLERLFRFLRDIVFGIEGDISRGQVLLVMAVLVAVVLAIGGARALLPGDDPALVPAAVVSPSAGATSAPAVTLGPARTAEPTASPEVTPAPTPTPSAVAQSVTLRGRIDVRAI